MTLVACIDGVRKSSSTSRNHFFGCRVQAVQTENMTRSNRSHICVFWNHEIKLADCRGGIFILQNCSSVLVRLSHGLTLRIAFGLRWIALRYLRNLEAMRSGNGLIFNKATASA